MILKNLKIFSQNVQKNRILTDIILENKKEFDIVFIQEMPWFYIQTNTSLTSKEREKIIGILSHLL